MSLPRRVGVLACHRQLFRMPSSVVIVVVTSIRFLQDFDWAALKSKKMRAPWRPTVPPVQSSAVGDLGTGEIRLAPSLVENVGELDSTWLVHW